MKSIIPLILMSLFASSVFSEDVNYYVRNNTLYVFNPFDHRTYLIKNYSSKGALVVKLIGDSSKIDSVKNKNFGEAKTIQVVDRVQISKYILECQKMYEEGRLKDAWDVLDLAENLDQGDYRIKKMKGSLLIEMGDVDAGRSMWNESLQINPNQPDLKSRLNELNSDD